jgi:hypothetical protein
MQNLLPAPVKSISLRRRSEPAHLAPNQFIYVIYVSSAAPLPSTPADPGHFLQG